MARIKISPLFSEVNGSIGSMTVQRSLGGVMLRNKPIRKPKQSPSQLLSNIYIAQCQAAWKSLTDAQRLEWSQYAEYNPALMKHNKTRRLNGVNLFCKYNLIRLQSGLAILSIATFLSPEPLIIDLIISTIDESFFVSTGSGTNSLAWSDDGKNWTGLGLAIFSISGYGVTFNGSLYAACGSGTNSLAWSNDGKIWTGLAETIFTTNGFAITCNSSLFVAAGYGTNSLAWSNDGKNWTGIGVAIFSTWGRGIVWNGHIFVAGGAGTNSLAWSDDGKNWTGLGLSIFSSTGYGIAWNGRIFVATGSGTNSLAYSYDGKHWLPLGHSIFTTNGYNVAWNGRIFVAAGAGTNSLAWSDDGINWSGLGLSIFSGSCKSITWNGQLFVAVGTGTNSIAWSADGKLWSGLGVGTHSTSGVGIIARSLPTLVPVINHPIQIDFNENLDDEDQWALIKLSNVRSPTENFKQNTTRVIIIPVSSSEIFDIESQLYELFGFNFFSGSIINVSVTLFSQTTGKVFPTSNYRLTVAALQS